LQPQSGKPIYFDGIDNSAYVTGKAMQSARDGWVYINGEEFEGVRADVGADPEAP
jgi:arylsulfatase